MNNMIDKNWLYRNHTENDAYRKIKLGVEMASFNNHYSTLYLGELPDLVKSKLLSENYNVANNSTGDTYISWYSKTIKEIINK